MYGETLELMLKKEEEDEEEDGKRERGGSQTHICHVCIYVTVSLGWYCFHKLLLGLKIWNSFVKHFSVTPLV